jgi:hypothetical protein
MSEQTTLHSRVAAGLARTEAFRGDDVEYIEAALRKRWPTEEELQGMLDGHNEKARKSIPDYPGFLELPEGAP